MEKLKGDDTRPPALNPMPKQKLRIK